MNRLSFIKLCTLAIIACAFAVSTANAQLSRPVEIDCTSSLIVIGDTTQSPLDEGSINGLFTSRFLAEVGEKLAERFGEDVAAAELTPSSVRFSYQGAEKGPGRVALLLVRSRLPNASNEDVQKEHIQKLRAEAPKIARDMLVENAYEFFNNAHEFHLREQRERLAQLRGVSDMLQAKLDALQQMRKESGFDAIESSESLKGVYHELTNRQRHDRMKRLAVQAKREAVEKQIEEISVRAEKDFNSAESRLLEQVKALAEAKQEHLAEAKRALEGSPDQIQSLRKLILEKEKAVTIAQQRYDAGNVTANDLELLKSSLAEAHYKLEHTKSELEQRARQAESAAMQARVAFLQASAQQKHSRSGGQISELNRMLTQLAIESDDAKAYRVVVEEELDQLQSQIRDLESNEAEAKKIDLQTRRLTKQLEAVENMRMQLELEADLPTKRDFKIMPWGP